MIKIKTVTRKTYYSNVFPTFQQSLGCSCFYLYHWSRGPHSKHVFDDYNLLTLSYLGGGQNTPALVFLHHPKTTQGIKLKLSDFKDTPLRHLLQVKPVRYILSCCHGNNITKGTSQNLAPNKSEKSAICKDIELKFSIETKYGPLS